MGLESSLPTNGWLVFGDRDGMLGAPFTLLQAQCPEGDTPATGRMDATFFNAHS